MIRIQQHIPSEGESASSGLQDTLDLDTWLPFFLQTADAQFPSGAYAHSFGLEGMVELGVVKDVDSLRAFLLTEVAETLVYQELPYLRFARAACAQNDFETLCELDCEIHAWRLPQENREASVSLGLHRLNMLSRLYPHALFTQLKEAIDAGKVKGHQIIVAAAQSDALQVPPAVMLWAHLYQIFANALQASLKLLRLGQECCQRLLGDCLNAAQAMIAESKEVTREDAGCSLVTLDLASARHKTAFSRLFIS